MHRKDIFTFNVSPPDRFLEVILKLRGQNSREDMIFVPRRWERKGGGREEREEKEEGREAERVKGREKKERGSEGGREEISE